MKTTTKKYEGKKGEKPKYFCEVCGATLTENYPDKKRFICTDCEKVRQ